MPNKTYTLAELKKLAQPELVHLGGQYGLSSKEASEMKMQDLIQTIVKAQEAEAAAEGEQPAAQPAAQTTEQPTEQPSKEDVQLSNVDNGSTEAPAASAAPIAEQVTPAEEAAIKVEIEAEETAKDIRSKADKGIEFIKVKSVQKEPFESGGFAQAFRETHPDHPDGAVWIADNKEHTVANTDAVQRALLDRKIEKV